ncbi:hypothetical protein Loa_01369 [Legionella oakridgensis ATCC 33761 = DSM 21215]|uniref:Uncharacterized protein n=3 Tax=Legionella oakridgensis TaxID=29423 RepID=W0BE75_9GAMM|nr:hypothetical protein Loa_01369 [Legionella oakridgensis ATCC 33761 = DSM 21215]ETO93378.1 hypothetical protein LOR_60c13990 [Legionella oakridgensis RV-2-2007]KTD39491.1 hypothetical protein Loak_0917 [Legionella oakridgensis]STY20029.1 Uncharacterised protein [Legionella longbeachae]
MNADKDSPIAHINKIQRLFKEQVEHLRKDITEIDESPCKAMFETSAEVLLGLIKAFEDYKEKKETAWQH